MPIYPSAPGAGPAAAPPGPRFGTVLVQFYGLSAAANREQEAMQRRYLRRQSQYEDTLRQDLPLLDDPQPALEALRRFLMALPEDSLRALAGLMAAGADGVEDVFVHWREVRGLLRDRTAAAEAVLLHHSRSEHVRLALACCAPLPVDDLPRRFARMEHAGNDVRMMLACVVPSAAATLLEIAATGPLP